MLFIRLDRWLSAVVTIRGSTPGSRLRRALTYFCAIMLAVFALDFFLLFFYDYPLFNSPLYASAFLSASLLYFLISGLSVLFLADRNYNLDILRLIKDTLFSIIFNIASFSLYYRFSGIKLNGKVTSDQCFGSTCECLCDASLLDQVYFSAVTFSTLGYGDFTPCPQTRMIAAFEALIGNLHLALILGACLLLTPSKERLENEAGQPEDGAHDDRKSRDGDDPGTARNNRFVSLAAHGTPPIRNIPYVSKRRKSSYAKKDRTKP